MTKIHLLPLQTGQSQCYDTEGTPISCPGSGQDGEFQAGLPWPELRFEESGDGLVLDRLTGLTWTRDANPGGFPLSWPEALVYVAGLNQQEHLGCADWRLPNRRELRSLIDWQATRPPLPHDHPFENVFQGWYWTSTNAAIQPAYAWYVHLQGARMFYGRKKDQYFMVWPCRGPSSPVLPRTGQSHCFDASGKEIPCAGTGQDGELRLGAAWPEPRFEIHDQAVLDRLTSLLWQRDTDLTEGPVTWQQALDAVARLNEHSGISQWRLPNINELESLVDCSRHNPALPRDHPFLNTREGYWSSTTSVFEPSWSWVLYMHKGAVGVGYKSGAHFFVWPVSGP
ncbi:MAG: DUF1566 domain-containing protein [Desulfohalobiaceae bacterium]